MTTATKTLEDFVNADTFDSRDVIERIEELEAIEAPDTDETAELATLRAFADDAAGYASDWQYGETFIAESYFEDYARELAEDIGAIKDDIGWPMTYIDWPAAADALLIDYSGVELEGRTFYTR